LAASVRNVEQVREIWKLGPEIATLPYDVFNECEGDICEMLKHPKTWEGAKRFSDDVPKSYADLVDRN